MYRTKRDSFDDFFPDGAEFLQRLSGGYMAGDLCEKVACRERKVIGILDDIEFDDQGRLFVENQGKNPIVGSNEVVSVMKNQCMRRLNGCFAVYGNDVNGAFREITVGMFDNKCRLVEIKRGNIM